ncbi:hypothetical protein D3C78_1001590 [compost metagenome]
MPQAVVELLEPIEIDVQQRQAAITALPHSLMSLVESFAKHRAVGQTGKFVVMGQIAHTLFGLSTSREISEEAHNMAHISPDIAHGIQLQPLRIHLAVLAGFHQFALPAALLLQRLMYCGVMPTRITTAWQLNDIAPDHVVDVIAGHPTEGLIDRDQDVVRIENHDPFAGRLEHGRRQLPLLFQAFARADIAASADHANHPAVVGTLDCPPAVLDPDPVAVAMPHAILDLIVLGAALQMLDQRPFQRRKILGVKARLEVTQYRRDLFRLQAEQFLNLCVMDFVGLQIPVPQPQLAGLQCQRQARLTLAQCLIGGVQFQAALSDSVFQVDLDLSQFVLGTSALFYLLGQLLIELITAALRLLQMLDQCLVLKASHQAPIDQSIDLPGNHAQCTEQNQPEPAPTLLLFVSPPKHIGDGRQQAGQGE